MAVLRKDMTPTALAMLATWEGTEKEWRRPHLGASTIGKKCQRAAWYTFRWVSRREYSETRSRGQMLRLFDRGAREESVVYQELRRAGFEVSDVDPATGQQWRVSFLGGHLAGACDGAVLGIPEAPRTWHLLEIKTHNLDRFEQVVKQGVQKSNPEHYDQMQVYMHGLGLTRALYVAVCKNDDRVHTERVDYDRGHADRVITRGQMIVDSQQPLERINKNPTWFECKMCDYYRPCQLGQADLVARNCRTCVSSTPRPDGSWWCDMHERILDIDEQRAGCSDHLIIPGLLPWDAIIADTDAAGSRRIVYTEPSGLRHVDVGGRLITAPEEP